MKLEPKKYGTAYTYWFDHVLYALWKQWGEADPPDFMLPRYHSPCDFWPTVVNPEPYRWYIGN